MNKAEYSDLYKFYVSIGIILIGIAFGFLWIFATSPVGDVYYYENYWKYIPNAKTIATIKLDLLLGITSYRFPIFLLLVIIGVILCVVGLRKWSEFQNMDDKLHQAKFKAAMKKLRPTSIQERKKNIAKDINSQLVIPMGGGGDELGAVEFQLHRQRQLKEEISQTYETENSFLSTLTDIFEDYTSVKYSQIGGRQVDLLLVPQTSGSEVVFIELKVLQTDYKSKNLAAFLTQMEHTADELHMDFGDHVKGCLIFVANPNHYPESVYSNIKSLNERYNPSNIFITIFKYNDFMDLDRRLVKYLILNGINIDLPKG